MPILQQVLGNEINCICPHCDVSNFVTPGLVPLSIPPNINTCSLQEIFDYNFELWPEVNNYCSKNCECRMLRGYDIKLVSTSLIIKLEIFADTEEGVRKIQNLKINEVPRAVVTVRNKKFKVVSAIFHHGRGFNTGTYDVMLRKGKSWIKINGKSVKKSSWPRSSNDIYIIFLERV